MDVQNPLPKTGKKKRCKNCKATFAAGAARLETHKQYNVRWCSNCGAVNSFKKNIYNLTIKTPALINLLKKYVSIKKDISFLRFENWGRHFLTPALQAEVAEFASSKNIGFGEAIGSLIGDYRFKKSTRQILEQSGALVKKLESCGFFSFASNNRLLTGQEHLDLVESLIVQDPEYLVKKVDPNVDLVEFKAGHYNGSPGNCAKKVATRKWRALRFLAACNQLVLKHYPDRKTNLIDLDYNKELDKLSLLSRVMPSSRGKVHEILQEAHEISNPLAPERLFPVSISRKETKYWIPEIAQPEPCIEGGQSEENKAQSKKVVYKPKTRKLFIQDYQNEANKVTQHKLSPKTFDYLAVMNIQNSEKVADVLKKMGDNIWLANVYTLNLPRTKPTRNVTVRQRPKNKKA